MKSLYGQEFNRIVCGLLKHIGNALAVYFIEFVPIPMYILTVEIGTEEALIKVEGVA